MVQFAVQWAPAMNIRLGLRVILGSAILYAVWQFLGHKFLMAASMPFRHWIDGTVTTILTALVAGVSVRVILSQHKKLAELARIRDYLLKMEAHYLRLPPESREDPSTYFETQAARSRFFEAQSRLASSSPAIRANALLELASLAGVCSGGHKSQLTMFGRAASHLAAAFYLEKDSVVRAQALTGVRQLGELAVSVGQGHPESLAEELAHGNRIAWEFFREAAREVERQRGVITSEDRDAIDALNVFHAPPEQIIALLHPEAANPPDDLDTVEGIGKTGAEESGKHSQIKGSLTALQNSAVILEGTCQGLAIALGMLGAPEDVPDDITLLRTWRRKHPLSLTNCFLGFMDLHEVHLAGADLSRTCVLGATMNGADLRRANFHHADLRDIQCYGALLQAADLSRTCLQRAGLSAVNLSSTDLSWARLEGAHLVGSRLDGAILFKARFVDDDVPIRAGDLTNANWWDARFDDPLTERVDTELQAWLRAHFRQPNEANTPHAA